jgi:hypothetical protein
MKFRLLKLKERKLICEVDETGLETYLVFSVLIRPGLLPEN